MQSYSKNTNILYNAISTLIDHSHLLGGSARQFGYRESHAPAFVLYLFLCQNDLWPKSEREISIPLYMIDKFVSGINDNLHKIKCTSTEAISLSSEAFNYLDKKIRLLRDETSCQWDIVGSVITNHHLIIQNQQLIHAVIQKIKHQQR